MHNKKVKFCGTFPISVVPGGTYSIFIGTYSSKKILAVGIFFLFTGTHGGIFFSPGGTKAGTFSGDRSPLSAFSSPGASKWRYF